MNEYTALVVATVRRYQGRPIDFAGDGVFVLFEPALAGRHFPLKAMHASLKLYKDFSRMQEKWLSQGIPILDIGIGIHIGPMMIGVMGSEQFLKMGASGDVVNIAARIQGLSQQCGYSVLVTQETYAHIQQEIAVDYCGDIAIKGRAKSVVVYGLTDTRLPFAMSESASTVTDIDASGFRIAH
jgi:adenylate cyclase